MSWPSRSYVHPGDPHDSALKCSECGCLVVDLDAHETHATTEPDARMRVLERRIEILEAWIVSKVMEADQ